MTEVTDVLYRYEKAVPHGRQENVEIHDVQKGEKDVQ
jgi:hypothetical protein